ncbi:MAG: hypothetical protein M1821_005382 [Bathelium mastoideum]|nr:MAG: hypothetical protein M1821_005382 [Bathelium mastoideum]
MPPRKKAKLSSAHSPRDGQPKTPGPTPDATAQAAPPSADALDDPWTDEQETELFKSIIRFKPTGLHKHFHMLSVSQLLISHGISTTSAPHTSISGIWKKLTSLYDLAALDEREYADAGWTYPDTQSELESPAGNVEEWEGAFALPQEDYGEMMWQRRFAPSPSSSEPEIPNIAVGKEDRPPTRLSPSVVIDIEESQSVKKGGKIGRQARGRPAAGRTRTVSGTKGRRGSKQESPQVESEDTSSSEDEGDEDEDASAPAKRGRAPVKPGKSITKATARRSTRKR